MSATCDPPQPILYVPVQTSKYAANWPKATDKATKSLLPVITQLFNTLPPIHPIISVGYNQTLSALKKGISSLIILSVPQHSSRQLFETFPPLCALHNIPVITLTYDSHQLGALVQQHSALAVSINFHSNITYLLDKKTQFSGYPTLFEKLINIHNTLYQDPTYKQQLVIITAAMTQLFSVAHHFDLLWVTEQRDQMKQNLLDYINANGQKSNCLKKDTKTTKQSQITSQTSEHYDIITNNDLYPPQNSESNVIPINKTKTDDMISEIKSNLTKTTKFAQSSPVISHNETEYPVKQSQTIIHPSNPFVTSTMPSFTQPTIIAPTTALSKIKTKKNSKISENHKPTPPTQTPLSAQSTSPQTPVLTTTSKNPFSVLLGGKSVTMTPSATQLLNSNDPFAKVSKPVFSSKSTSNITASVSKNLSPDAFGKELKDKAYTGSTGGSTVNSLKKLPSLMLGEKPTKLKTTSNSTNKTVVKGQKTVLKK